MSSGSRLNHPVIRAPRHRCPRRKLTDGCIQRLDLDDEMTEARAEVDLTLDRIVDEFDGDELVARASSVPLARSVNVDGGSTRKLRAGGHAVDDALIVDAEGLSY